MSDKDHWKSLADDIGAEVPADRYESPATADRNREAAPSPSPAASPRSRPKRQRPTTTKKVHWNQLADELGVEAEDPEPATPVDSVSSVSDGSDEVPETGHVVEEVTEISQEVSVAPEPWALPSATADFPDQPIAGPLPDLAGRDAVAPGELSPDTYDNDPLVVRHEPFVDEVPTANDIDSEADEDEGPPVEDEVAESDEPRPRRRRRRGGRRRRRDVDRTDTAEVPATSGDVEVEPQGTAECDNDADSSGEPDEVVAVEEPRRRRRRRRRPAPSGTDESSTEAEVVESAPEAPPSDGEGRTRSKHKKIPSWSEAIGVIVTTNLNSREKTPSGGRGSRRRGG